MPSVSIELTQPLHFVPHLQPRVWGGRRLQTVLRRDLPTAESYGESWEVSDHAAHRSEIAAGPLAGHSLRRLLHEDRAALLGGAAETAVFPWLIKFLDCHDWLSVQVHPDDAGARRLCPAEGGKTEAWFVLDAQPDSRIYAGLRPGVDAARLREALARGGVANCLHSFAPRPGDCVFLPAGTVHAVGGGVLMAEVQQTSDATFRLYDWDRPDADGRPRALHVEEALASIDWRQGPVQPIRARGAGRQVLVRCPYFVLEHVSSTADVDLGAAALRAVIVLQGRAHLHGELMGPGDVRVLPAALAAARLEPVTEFAALVCTLPAGQ